MREGALVQTLHFNSLLLDPNAVAGDYSSQQTEWMQSTFPKERVSMPVPIVLPVTGFTKRAIGKAEAVALTNSAGVPLAILRNPEVRVSPPQACVTWRRRLCCPLRWRWDRLLSARVEL